MSEEKDPNGKLDDNVNDSHQEHQQTVNDSNAETKDTVKYESYRKVVSANKAKDAKLDELVRRNAELEQNTLESEGRKDELIASLKAQNVKLDSQYKTAVGSFAQGKALDAIVDVAVKSGCVSTGLLRKVVSDRVGELDFDDQFNPNGDQVNMLIEDIKKSEPVLFNKQAPAVAKHNLNPQGVNTKKKSVSEMTIEEQEQLAKQIDKSEGKTLGWS